MKQILVLVTTLLLYTVSASGFESEEGKELPSLKTKTSGMQAHSGFFDFYWDVKTGKLWLQIDKWQTEFLYINSLAAGVGSNDIGLDRGQLGASRVVKFERIGPRVLLVQPNYSYRAISRNEAEKESVEQAFAQSVLWGFEVAAETGETVLVDATDFFMRDAHDVVGTLKQTQQGDYKLDATRSAFYPPRTKSFPKNSEVEVTLTFVGDSPGDWVRSVVPTPQAITVRQHHSFVQLPDDDYEPRLSDPRAGYFGIRYQDYATPISAPLTRRFISRHRLRKKDPTATQSEAVRPIIYYVDPGAPEPIRSALVTGAGWWNAAFEAAGYKNAFQVKILPAGADPMDVRYNVIQWVHRSTRGWSYGGGVIDPRTGEIIKGHVSLGSLRVRQDFLIAQGLLSPYESGATPPTTMQEMALARLRQLAAHEVGHTLGLSHNFAASVSDRGSVMDYPHPYVRVRPDGSLDFSEAYGVGVGAWDKVAIAYGYQDFPKDRNEHEALQQIIAKSITDGLIFITDQDARPAGGAHPLAHLWDNGSDAVDDLTRIMQVRATALKHFSQNSIPENMPLSSLEEVLVPLYMSHRYQVDATSKLLGGLYYTYALRGDGQKVTEIVSAGQQRRALRALLDTIQPEALAIPDEILNLIPPRAFGTDRDRETFNIRTGVTFDPLAAAETAANETMRFLFHAARAARLVEFHARNSNNPGLAEVIEQVVGATWKAPHGSGFDAEVRRVVDNVVLYHLMALAANEEASNQVRAIAHEQLAALLDWTTAEARKFKEALRARETLEANSEGQRSHLDFAALRIRQFREHPDDFHLSRPVPPPAGSPIGYDVRYCNWNNSNWMP